MAAKQKTHRASAKRFKRTGNGGLKRNMLTHHTVSTARRLSNVANCVKLQWYPALI